MTKSSDPLNCWIGNHRQDVLPADGVALRSKPTMICYFASPRASLTTAGVYRDESDKNLTEAYLRTTISQFFNEMEEQVFSGRSDAGAICFGTRVLRTSIETGYAFYRDPNQYIFNMSWVNCSERLQDGAEPNVRELTTASNIIQRLTILLRASHEVSHLILDTSGLLGLQGFRVEQIVQMIREAIIEADFVCDQLTILWPGYLAPVLASNTLTMMWGEDEPELLYSTEDMEVDYDADDNMDDVQQDDLELDWRDILFKEGVAIENIKDYSGRVMATLQITSVVAPWSPEVDQPHPFLSARKQVAETRSLDRKQLAEDSYWVGSDNCCQIFPTLLLSCLRR